MSIFSHIVVGSNDLEKSRTFYDAVLAPLGISRLMDMDVRSVWGVDAPQFCVTQPIDGAAATHANGGTIGFRAADHEAVDKFHAAALANGGRCEGEPGPRASMPGLYAAYIRDLDGNKLCAAHFGQP